MAFAGAKPDDDLYRMAAIQLKDLLGNAVIVTCCFDAATGNIEQRALVGVPLVLSQAAERMRVAISPMPSVANPEAIEQMTRGRLLEI